jgi:hypothetical protein
VAGITAIAGICRQGADLAKDTDLVNKRAGAGKGAAIIAMRVVGWLPELFNPSTLDAALRFSVLFPFAKLTQRAAASDPMISEFRLFSTHKDREIRLVAA